MPKPRLTSNQRQAQKHIKQAIALAQKGRCDGALQALVEGALLLGSVTPTAVLPEAGKRLKHLSRTIVAACPRPGH